MVNFNTLQLRQLAEDSTAEDCETELFLNRWTVQRNIIYFLILIEILVPKIIKAP